MSTSFTMRVKGTAILLSPFSSFSSTKTSIAKYYNYQSLNIKFCKKKKEKKNRVHEDS